MAVAVALMKVAFQLYGVLRSQAATSAAVAVAAAAAAAAEK